MCARPAPFRRARRNLDTRSVRAAQQPATASAFCALANSTVATKLSPQNLLGNHSMRGQVPAQGVALSGGGVKLPAWLASSLVPHPKPQDTHSHQPAPNTPAATQQAPSGKRENQVQGRSTGGTVSSTRLVLHVGRVTARFHARLLSVSCGVLCTACMLALAATHQLTLRHMAVPQAQTSTRCSWALAFLSTARTPRRLQASMQCRGALRSK